MQPVVRQLVDEDDELLARRPVGAEKNRRPPLLLDRVEAREERRLTLDPYFLLRTDALDVFECEEVAIDAAPDGLRVCEEDAH